MKKLEGGMYQDSLDKLKGVHISSLDDDDEEDQNIVVDEDDYEDDDEEEEQEPVILGFVEKPKNKWSLLRQLFPSKAGGTPAWLDPVNLPSGKCSLCDMCGEPLQFLLQVYAPLEKDSTFHRMLYVFMCQKMTCLLRDQHEQWKRPLEKPCRSVKAFRCQLPCLNPFYSSEPPKRDGKDEPSGPGVSLCHWCGTWSGSKVCSSCRVAHYCSPEHQAVHWRSSHKIECQQLNLYPQLSNSNSSNGGGKSLSKIPKAACNTLWPEYEVINEDERDYDTDMSEDNGHANSLICKIGEDDTMKSLLNSFEGDADRKSWASFQERVTKAPEQVLRYCRSAGAKIQWPMASGRPSKADIPNCTYCEGPLCFEFQILPQLLYYFGVKNDADSLDWATIAVYTCEASCDASISYKEEFVWVQLYSSSTVS